jgi:hypothetical protein
MDLNHMDHNKRVWKRKFTDGLWRVNHDDHALWKHSGVNDIKTDWYLSFTVIHDKESLQENLLQLPSVDMQANPILLPLLLPN